MVVVNFVFFFVNTNFSFLAALLATDYVATPVVENTGEARETVVCRLVEWL